jgi:hypothetical protein
MTSQRFDPSPDAIALQVSNVRKSTSEPLAFSFKIGRSRLGADFEPSNHSVICGRGKDNYNHVGNQRFRILTRMFLERYSQSKSAKSAIVSHIVATIRLEGGETFAGMKRVHQYGLVKLEITGHAKSLALCCVTCCILNTDPPPRPRSPVGGLENKASNKSNYLANSSSKALKTRMIVPQYRRCAGEAAWIP